MAEVHAVAISPDKTHLVVKKGEHHYAVIHRGKGITKDTQWKNKKVVSQMVIKGGYKRFKKPVKYKGFDKVEKSAKSVQRLDEGVKGKKKSKHQELIVDLGLENFEKDVITHVRKSEPELIIKADNSHLPKNAERFSYNCSENYNIVYIPVNRLKEVYQTKEALNPATIKRKAKEMKSGKAMPPVYIGYDYDVHDGHHSWNAAMANDYTHVPCKVVGSDPKKVKEAIAKYKQVWKSEGELKIVPLSELKQMAEQEREAQLKDDLTKLSLDEFVKVLTGKAEKSLREDLWKPKPKKQNSGKDNVDENKRIDPVEDEELWEKQVEKNDKKFRSELGIDKSIDLSLVLDLSKAVLNTGKLVKRRVMVRGKNGKTFYRMQWVDPRTGQAPGMSHPGVDHSTYHHHEEGLKEMEKRQSNRFPVVHHPTAGLKNTDHNYRQDKEKYKEAEEKYKKGEKLPPVKITPHGEILDNHHLVDLAKKHGLTHTPTVVVGNTTLKKELEDKLKDRVIQEDESGQQTDLTAKHPNQGATAETVADLEQFNNFTKKKYTKQHLMNEAKRQGIKWNEKDKEGNQLAVNSKILWMRAHEAIKKHILDGNHFEVSHDEKDVDKRMQQDGKDTIHKHFLKLLEKHGSKDAMMEWARDNGITWKEKSDPSINWMYAVTAIKHELAKGRMVDGVRTRQKKAQEQAHLIVSDEVKAMVKGLGTKYGKSRVMKRAEELGITFDRMTKKGEQLPENSNILWMRAHSAIAEHISKGNEFKMGDEQDSGIKAEVGDYGNVKLSKMQSYAVDLAKRKSHNREEKAKRWALKALMIDKGLEHEQAEQAYNQLMEKARSAKVLVHFDPFELLPNGVNLIDQITSDGEFKNDYALNRGYDREHREANEGDMFGDDYNSEAEDSDRPNYATVDLFNKGLKSHPYNGEVAFVLKDDAKKRTTGSHIDSNSIPYGEEARWVRSMEDPHHLLIDRWTARWKQPNKADGQRSRAFDSILNGKEYKDDNRFFEAHVHGGIKFDRDVDHVLVPSSWRTDKDHADKHNRISEFAKLHGIELKYEG